MAVKVSGWTPVCGKGCEHAAIFYPGLFLVAQFLFSKWRAFGGRLLIWHLKSQQQKTSLLFCLLPEQRTQCVGGEHWPPSVQALSTLFLLWSHISSRECRLHFSDKETEEKALQPTVLVAFSSLPTSQGAAVGLDPSWRPTCSSIRGASSQKMPGHHGHLPHLRGRDRGVTGVTP